MGGFVTKKEPAHTEQKEGQRMSNIHGMEEEVNQLRVGRKDAGK